MAEPNSVAPFSTDLPRASPAAFFLAIVEQLNNLSSAAQGRKRASNKVILISQRLCLQFQAGACYLLAVYLGCGLGAVADSERFSGLGF